MTVRTVVIGLAVLCLASGMAAAEAPVPETVGYRGNWTGLYPGADPPVRWGRIARGVLAGMTCQAARPAQGAAGGGPPVKDGLVRQWLVAGPFPVADSVKDFDGRQIPGETGLTPDEGEGAGRPAWQRLDIPRTPDYERWGTTALDWVDLGEVVGHGTNQVAYAHTYLYCERPGDVRAAADHAYGLKVWLNGEVVYAEPRRVVNLGSYVGISRQARDLVLTPSPAWRMTMKRGWNRLLVKCAGARTGEPTTQKFALRLMDAGPVPYDERNVLWKTPLPGRSNAPPVVVGNRLFLTAEPDELLCLDKETGRILWRRLNGLYEATAEEFRSAHPTVAEQIVPLAGQLAGTTEPVKGLELRRRIHDLLVGADRNTYELKWDGHLAAHFGIVGFTTTAVSDGRHVYAFFGYGVAACYDLDGNLRWIRRMKAAKVRYSCSPALIGGRLICVFDGMRALDAHTGEVLWRLPDVASIASLIPARIRDTDVVSTRDGCIFRASDGRPLWENPHVRTGDTGWAAPLILGNVLYVPWYGVCNLIVADFSDVEGDVWKPKVRVIEVNADHRRPNGEWLDRSTASSPLVCDGIYYNIDQYGVFYAVDLETGKTLYREDVGFDELHHYNAIGVCASPTLGGRHIYVMDNQGVCVVLEPGRVLKRVAVNRIETVLARPWPIGPQEILANAAPVFDGGHIYVRGERYLYCIGHK